MTTATATRPHLGTLASSPEDHADMSPSRLEWVRGRRGSLMAFDAKGDLVHHLVESQPDLTERRLRAADRADFQSLLLVTTLWLFGLAVLIVVVAGTATLLVGS